MSELLADLSAALDARLRADSQALEWWSSQRGSDALRLEVALPQLPRRLGRALLGEGRKRSAELEVDFGVWRLCDAGAAILLGQAGVEQSQIDDLFAHGDFEERAMLMRSRAILPVDQVTIRLFGEAQRTNTQDHVDALTLDSNLVARATDDGLPLEDFNRLILKAAFVDMPLARMFDAERHANQTLSAMLQDFATEREAAGRKVWSDTARLIGRAPAPGSLARLLGGLEHGADSMRLAAIDGLAAMGDLSPQNRTTIQPFLTERVPREPHPEIRTALRAALEAAGQDSRAKSS